MLLRASAAAAGYCLLSPLAARLAVALPEGNELLVRSAEPLNAEPRLVALATDRITAVKNFYVRNHGPIPRIELRDHKITIEGLVHKPFSLSIAELNDRFSQYEVEATLTCAGNRRQEISAIKPVTGVQWDAGAIGNARWTGAALADVLQAAEWQEGAKHVWFEGLDPIKEKDGSVAPFGGSIPLARALAGNTALLAHAMNGAPLTAEHGYPLRTVVSGYIGARSVKWLSKITVSDRPSPNHYVAAAYKLVQSEDQVQTAAAEPIYPFPVNAAICSPAAGSKLKAGRTTIAGYALPSGESACTIDKVELSRDGGRTWTAANLAGDSRPFAWRLWTAEIDLPPGRHELAVRATDSCGNSMPEHGAWNFKGYLFNGWNRLNVEVS